MSKMFSYAYDLKLQILNYIYIENYIKFTNRVKLKFNVIKHTYILCKTLLCLYFGRRAQNPSDIWRQAANDWLNYAVNFLR